MSSTGAIITEMDASDLIGRLILNENRAEFVVTRLTFNARSARVTIWIAQVDEETGQPEDAEAGLENLNGWSIHQKLIS